VTEWGHLKLSRRGQLKLSFPATAKARRRPRLLDHELGGLATTEVLVAGDEVGAPELVDLDAKRKLTQKVESAISDAYRGIANTGEVVVAINQHSRDNVS
jgi:hypothetical protein